MFQNEYYYWIFNSSRFLPSSRQVWPLSHPILMKTCRIFATLLTTQLKIQTNIIYYAAAVLRSAATFSVMRPLPKLWRAVIRSGLLFVSLKALYFLVFFTGSMLKVRWDSFSCGHIPCLFFVVFVLERDGRSVSFIRNTKINCNIPKLAEMLPTLADNFQKCPKLQEIM